jgi:hypothetical protein
VGADAGTHPRCAAANDDDSFRYIYNWLAWAVQNPGERAEVALVLAGGKGTGKGTLGNTMIRIFGAHGTHVSNRKHLTSGFNRHLMHCSFLFADEAYWPGDKQGEGELKRLITEPLLLVEPKGIDGFLVNNCLHVIIVGNEDWLVPASFDERRFAVFKIEEPRARPHTYFDALYAELEGGGREAMLYDLLHHDLCDWHPRKDIPQTTALMEQKEESLHGVDALVAALCHDGALPYPRGDDPGTCVTGGVEGGTLRTWARDAVPGLKYKSSHSISRDLTKNWGCTPRHSGALRWIEFPTLGELRRMFIDRYGKTVWANALEEWT